MKRKKSKTIELGTSKKGYNAKALTDGFYHDGILNSEDVDIEEDQFGNIVIMALIDSDSICTAEETKDMLEEE